MESMLEKFKDDILNDMTEKMKVELSNVETVLDRKIENFKTETKNSQREIGLQMKKFERRIPRSVFDHVYNEDVDLEV